MRKIDGKWSPFIDQDEMLTYNWEIDNNEEDQIILNSASNNVQLGSYSGWQNVDAKECGGGAHNISCGGCQECSDSEVYNFKVKSKLNGSMRLKVNSYVECRCGGSDCNEIEVTSFIAFLI